MDNFSEALAAVNDLKRDGIVADYAIGGAMAFTFWADATPTFDLDVFVILPHAGTIVSLDAIYRWSRGRGYQEEAEHIVVSGVPVQFIPAHNALAEEAITTAAELTYDGRSVRVIRPEYLIALSLEGSARTAKRLARAEMLMEEDVVDHALLKEIVRRFNLRLPEHT